jgi:hypothetical protein
MTLSSNVSELLNGGAEGEGVYALSTLAVLCRFYIMAD